MKTIIFFILLVRLDLGAQTLPKIDLTTVPISQGNQQGFVMTLPGITPDVALEEWRSFTYLLFPPVQPGEDQPSIPLTVEDDVKDHEYHTTGLYLPNLSQNTVEAFILIDSVPVHGDQTAGSPATTFSLVLDFGNDNFLDTDDFYQSGVAKHLLDRFYLSVIQSLTG